jgi:hypothetical protein
MTALSYGTIEVLAYLLVFALLFGAVLIVLLVGILLDKGLRSCFLSLKCWLQSFSTGTGARFRPMSRALKAITRL